MAISEESRHYLHQRLGQVLGPAEATVLMEHLPPVGWTDVATKHYLDALETRVGMRFERVEERFSAMERRFDDRFTGMDRRFDDRFTGMDRRFDGLDAQMRSGFVEVGRRFDETFREFRSLLVAVMSVMVVLFGIMMGGVVAAIKI